MVNSTLPTDAKLSAPPIDSREIGLALGSLYELRSKIKDETIRNDIWMAYNRIARLTIQKSEANPSTATSPSDE